MKHLELIENIHQAINDNNFALFYFSTEKCNVCKTLKPKVIEMLEEFPQVKSFYVDLEKLTEASGYFTVFSIPTILVFIEGKETLRESRNISLREFQEKIARYYNLLF
ncbi:MAG: thiol reductase thioredoxin [Ignavibacteria bacterium GWF2_33_9]|nr:MAG: thiol reductase thioredoxin [Ignavibacteria bacterium GWF2_33_9]